MSVGRIKELGRLHPNKPHMRGQPLISQKEVEDWAKNRPQPRSHIRKRRKRHQKNS